MNRWEQRGHSNQRAVAEVKIEQKLFLITLGRRGSTVCMTERTRKASYLLELELELELESVHWFWSKLWEYITKPQTCSEFNRFRGKEAVLSMQKFINGKCQNSVGWAKGSASLFQVVDMSGGGNVWQTICSKLLQRGVVIGEILEKTCSSWRQHRRLVNTDRKTTNSGNNADYEHFRPCTVKNWHKALIITKECVNISWELMRVTLGKAVKRQIEIFLFQANKAVWWPNNEDDASFYLQLKKCFLEKKVTLSFERWRQMINRQEEVFECCHSWVRIFGIPWDLWTTDLFKNIGEPCGGLLDISQDTILLKDLSAAKIKVVGLEGGFINSFMQIITQNGPMVIRIVVDSVNIAMYDTYERRSYAQVVVNGARVIAGWSRAKGSIGVGSDPVTSAHIHKINVVDAENQKQNIEEGSNGHKKQDSKFGKMCVIDGVEVFINNAQECANTLTEQNKVQEDKSGRRPCESEPVVGGRQVKILKR